MNGKYPKHHETSRKAIKKIFENVDLLKVPKFPRGGRSRRFGTFPKFDLFLLLLKASLTGMYREKIIHFGREPQETRKKLMP